MQQNLIFFPTGFLEMQPVNKCVFLTSTFRLVYKNVVKTKVVFYQCFYIRHYSSLQSSLYNFNDENAVLFPPALVSNYYMYIFEFFIIFFYNGLEGNKSL